jgi:hypothetical protein
MHFSCHNAYEGVSKSFRTGRLGRELQMVQLFVTRCNCIAILSVSLVSFAAITFCVASQRVFTVVISLTQSGNFWIHPCITFRKRVSFSYLSSDIGRCERIHKTCSAPVYVHLEPEIWQRVLSESNICFAMTLLWGTYFDKTAITEGCRPFTGHTVHVLSFATDWTGWGQIQKRKWVGQPREAKASVSEL